MGRKYLKMRLTHDNNAVNKGSKVEEGRPLLSGKWDADFGWQFQKRKTQIFEPNKRGEGFAKNEELKKALREMPSLIERGGSEVAQGTLEHIWLW